MATALALAIDPKPARGLLQFGDRANELHGPREGRFCAPGKPLHLAAARPGGTIPYMTLVGRSDPRHGWHARHGGIHRSNDLDGRARSRQLWPLTGLKLAGLSALLTCARKIRCSCRHCGGFHCVNGLPAAAQRTSTSVVPGFARCAQLSDVSNCQSPQIPSTFDRNCRM